MEKLFIGIPVLNRLDLLLECLDAIDMAAEIVLVNNNSIDPQFKRQLTDAAAARQATVLHQPRNLGVAASWNLIVREGIERGHEWFLIHSNDTILQRGSLKAALEMGKDDDVALWCLHEWNCFLLSRRTIERVGWFDENFYPAYKEDQDYAYRCGLAGLKHVDVAGAGAKHVGSATIASNPDYAAQCGHTHFDWNLNHYRMKWGGDAGQERFVHPYDNPEHDLKWWPDPGRTIELRDWDNIYRRTTRELYDRAATTPSDIWEHVPVLYKYGSAVRHVTEIGTGNGAATAAFLFAQPETLVTYDEVRRPAVSELEAAARHGGIDFHFALFDGRSLQAIYPTDLLFIDTGHSREPMERLLRLESYVGRFLIVHDTETFGIDGEGAAPPQGIWPAIAGLLRASGAWEIEQIYRNNNGLTILKRVRQPCGVA